ncbi:hypothetical protein [Nocardia sp. FDAARGOS_372]|uniref:hypothetical protein n=1 Tax=Nocardia sp. FDAARGOS_372 TaxID=2018066 RepID=UPI000FDC8C6F|nr:hypothetical protein [Nocardia sp. FDAARGOS_372]
MGECAADAGEDVGVGVGDERFDPVACAVAANEHPTAALQIRRGGGVMTTQDTSWVSVATGCAHRAGYTVPVLDGPLVPAWALLPSMTGAKLPSVTQFAPNGPLARSKSSLYWAPVNTTAEPAPTAAAATVTATLGVTAADPAPVAAAGTVIAGVTTTTTAVVPCPAAAAASTDATPVTTAPAPEPAAETRPVAVTATRCEAAPSP